MVFDGAVDDDVAAVNQGDVKILEQRVCGWIVVVFSFVLPLLLLEYEDPMKMMI